MRHGGQEVGLVAIGFLDQPVLFERFLGQFTHLDELRFQVDAGARDLVCKKDGHGDQERADAEKDGVVDLPEIQQASDDGGQTNEPDADDPGECWARFP